MKFSDLSAEDQQLVNTQFPEELEKQAAEEVALFNESYAMGFEKLATDAADYFDKAAESKEEEEEEEKEHSKEAHERAAEIGAVIERGYFDGLKKLGQERHNDEWHYLRPAIDEKIAGIKDMAGKAWGAVKNAPGKAYASAKKGVGAAKDYHVRHAKGVKEHGTAIFAKGKSMKERAGHAGHAAMHAGKGLAPAGAAAGAGFGGYKGYQHYKKKKEEKE